MANLPINPKQIIADGYDRIAERYVEWSHTVRIAERARYLSVIAAALPPGAKVLDLGCGAGTHAREMHCRFKLTAVDISRRLADMARVNLPGAHVLHADMTTVDFPEMWFDGVCAFYSLFHLPRHELGPLLKRIGRWLRSGGLFVGTMGSTATPVGLEEDWLGAPMFWSSYDRATNLQLVTDAGLTVVSAKDETCEEFGKPTTFLWIVARKRSQ